MKLFKTPQSIADFTMGDIVYTIYNDEIIQAKVVGYSVMLRYSDCQLLDGFYKFETARGDQFTVDFIPPHCGSSNIYATVKDLRNDNDLRWFYPNTVKGEVQESIRKSLRDKYGIHFSDKSERFVIFTNKDLKIKPFHFETIVDRDGELYAKTYNDEMSLSEMLSNGYYVTKEDCDAAFTYNVVTFENCKPKKVKVKMTTEIVTELDAADAEKLLGDPETYRDLVADGKTKSTIKVLD